MTIATTDIEFSYGRPSMRGRKIFGELEPYDVIWRGGANRNPRLVMSKDFLLGDQKVKAGSYTLFSKPNLEEWTVYLYDEINQYGAPETWDEAKVVASINVKPLTLPRPIETLHYTFEEISNDHFTLVLEWETTRVVIPFKLTTREQMGSKIAKALSGPNSSDYSNAGMYALRDGKDYEQAIKWFDKAIELDDTPGYWEHLFRAQALELLGRKKEAIAGATRALAFAKQSNSDYGVNESEAIIARLK
jgi:tetratricopeptide (TPR) repeat protein